MRVALLFPAASMLLAGMAIALVAIRTADGRIGRNRFAGIRTRATMASDDNWLLAHVAARGATIRAGQTFMISAAILPFGPLGLVLAMLGILVGIVWLFRGARAGVRAVTPIERKKK